MCFRILLRTRTTPNFLTFLARSSSASAFFCSASIASISSSDGPSGTFGAFLGIGDLCFFGGGAGAGDAATAAGADAACAGAGCDGCDGAAVNDIRSPPLPLRPPPPDGAVGVPSLPPAPPCLACLWSVSSRNTGSYSSLLSAPPSSAPPSASTWWKVRFNLMTKAAASAADTPSFCTSAGVILANAVAVSPAARNFAMSRPGTFSFSIQSTASSFVISVACLPPPGKAALMLVSAAAVSSAETPRSSSCAGLIRASAIPVIPAALNFAIFRPRILAPCFSTQSAASSVVI